jgi:hypothetical protein
MLRRAACKIVLLIQPEVDSPPSNNFTPRYVFGTNYATYLVAAPQDSSACKGFPGSGTLPYTGTLNPGDVIIWNANACSNAHGSTSCSCAGGGCANTTGFPVVYETPIVTAYQTFLKALTTDYSTGGPDASIGQYFAYVRVGMASGSENFTYCSEVTGSLALAGWPASTALPAGYAITPTGATNAGGYTFIALNAGTTSTSGTVITWNQTAGDRTTTDNTITWENVGTRGTTGVATWPGQTGLALLPNGYKDNGYLAKWSPTGTQGYIGNMVQFLGNITSPAPTSFLALLIVCIGGVRRLGSSSIS